MIGSPAAPRCRLKTRKAGSRTRAGLCFSGYSEPGYTIADVNPLREGDVLRDPLPQKL